MSQTLESPTATFFNRRNPEAATCAPVCERRQFADARDGLSPDAEELAVAIDAYKLRHRRRFITYEEMLAVIKSLGYQK